MHITFHSLHPSIHNIDLKTIDVILLNPKRAKPLFDIFLGRANVGRGKLHMSDGANAGGGKCRGTNIRKANVGIPTIMCNVM